MKIFYFLSSFLFLKLTKHYKFLIIYAVKKLGGLIMKKLLNRFKKQLKYLGIAIGYVMCIGFATYLSYLFIYLFYPAKISSDAWLDYFGNIIGATIGALAVGFTLVITIHRDNKIRHNDEINKIKPFICIEFVEKIAPKLYAFNITNISQSPAFNIEIDNNNFRCFQADIYEDIINEEKTNYPDLEIKYKFVSLKQRFYLTPLQEKRIEISLDDSKDIENKQIFFEIFYEDISKRKYLQRVSFDCNFEILANTVPVEDFNVTD